MKRALMLLAALALGACATVADTSAGPTAGIGQLAGAGPLLIRPLALIEDSRCPADVQCVWAGRLVLRAEIKGRGGRKVHDLTLGEKTPIDGGQLLLASAEPGKSTTGAIQPLAYRFTFNFGRS